jgi:hypothetical protein
MPASFLGTIGRVKRRHADTFLLHINEQILQGRITGHGPGGKAGCIVGIVKVGGHLGAAQLPTVITNVENLGRNVVKERQETTYALGNVRFT